MTKDNSSTSSEFLVYHYTSIKSLQSIVENKSLWLTSMQSTNDKDEVTHAREFAEKYIKTLCQKNTI